MRFALLSLAFALLLCLGYATPVNLAQRDVYVPPVLFPRNGTVWTARERHHVTWDTSNPPAQITNKIGFIMLRKGGLTTPVILAQNFSILLGRIEVIVPWVVDGDDYQVVLFGDSGNFSPFFSIRN